MDSSLIEYFQALERLVQNRPQRLPVGTEISNDAVSEEAGRGKGSIKKARKRFEKLLIAIDEAKKLQKEKTTAKKDNQAKAKESSMELREQLDAALAREVSLLRELMVVKKALSKLTGENVFPLRGTRQNSTNGL